MFIYNPASIARHYEVISKVMKQVEPNNVTLEKFKNAADNAIMQSIPQTVIRGTLIWRFRGTGSGRRP